MLKLNIKRRPKNELQYLYCPGNKDIVLLLIFLTLYPENAYAYLDPGSGSYILQLLIGGFLAGLFIIKLAWTKTKLFFSSLFSGGSNDNKGEKEQLFLRLYRKAASYLSVSGIFWSISLLNLSTTSGSSSDRSLVSFGSCLKLNSSTLSSSR